MSTIREKAGAAFLNAYVVKEEVTLGEKMLGIMSKSELEARGDRIWDALDNLSGAMRDDEFPTLSLLERRVMADVWEQLRNKYQAVTDAERAKLKQK